jgi:c-di-GMP-binding flagellar brake protein YcgR
VSDRNYFRLAVNIPLQIDIVDVPVPLQGTLVDISEGGCKITAKSMLLKGVEIAFELPRKTKEPLKLRGRVCHIDFKPMTKTFDYGIQYIGLRPADSDAIYQFVVEEQRRKLQTREGHLEATKNGKAKDRQAVLRVERKFPIQYAIFGQRAFAPAMATDISRGGMRVILDRAIPEDRTLELRFTLPEDVLDVLTRRTESRDGSLFGREITVKEEKARPFVELRMQVKLLPGWHEVKGLFHYSVSFLRPKPQMLEEIERFIHAAQLTEIKAKRAPQKTVWR